MTRLCNIVDKFDTVEEFWDESYLDEALSYALETDGGQIIRQFERDFVSRLDVDKTALFVPSGRDALLLALKYIKPRGGNFVLVPNFTCPVVGDAILGAGLQICTFDFSPQADWKHWKSLEAIMQSGKVNAVIIPHLFGLPCDIRPLLKIARRYHISIIEDCAHCFGGKIDGIPVGTRGDFSVFSFNYDKPMSLGGGGMLVCDPLYMDREKLMTLKSEVEKRFLSIEEERKILAEFIAWLCNRRHQIGAEKTVSAFDVLNRWAQKILPRLGRGKTNPVKPARSPWLSGVGVLRASLGIRLLREYSSVMDVRNHNYQIFKDFVVNHRMGDLLDDYSPSVTPAWIKAKLIVHNKSQREIDALGRYMRSQGFRVGRFNWPYTLSQKFPDSMIVDSATGGKESMRMANFSLDVPIHQNMGDAEMDKMMQGMLEWLQ